MHPSEVEAPFGRHTDTQWDQTMPRMAYSINHLCVARISPRPVFRVDEMVAGFGTKCSRDLLVFFLRSS